MRAFNPVLERLDRRDVPSSPIFPPQVLFQHPAMIGPPGAPPLVAGLPAIPPVLAPYLVLYETDLSPADVIVSPPTFVGPLSKPHVLYPVTWTSDDIHVWEEVDWYIQYGPKDPFQHRPMIAWPCPTAHPADPKPWDLLHPPCPVTPTNPVP